MADGGKDDDEPDEHDGDSDDERNDSDVGHLSFGPAAANASGHCETERRRRWGSDVHSPEDLSIVLNFFSGGPE